MNYREYLKTQHWIDFKNKVYIRKPKCKICGRKTYLNIHHKNYENLWHETMRDVVVLCFVCHHKTHVIEHGKYKEPKTKRLKHNYKQVDTKTLFQNEIGNTAKNIYVPRGKKKNRINLYY